MHISFTKRKMHIIYSALAIISLLLAGVSHVRAQETTESVPPPQRGEEMRNALEMKQTGLTEEQQNRFINLVRNVFNRMDGAVSRLENIAGRIETRLETLEAQGVDTSLARTPLDDAQSKLVETKAQLARAKAQAEDGIISDTPRERFTEAREQFATSRQLIRDSYILLREALAELKDAVMEADLNKNGQGDAATNGTAVSESVTQ